MAITPSIVSPARDQTETRRRGLPLVVAAALLVGTGVTTAGVTMATGHNAPVPVQHPVGAALAPTDVDGQALPAGVSSREYSARVRAGRLSRAG